MKYQKLDLKRKSSRSHKVVSAWSIVCARDLGLLQESSLKDVTIISYLDLNFLRTTKESQRSSDFETSDHEDVVSNRISASIFGSSWPFIDPAQITRITSSKSVRRRSKKRRWSTKRQRKPNLDNVCWDINEATTNLSIKRAASSLPGKSQCENLGVSNGGPTGLSENKFSLTQLDARWSDRDNGGNRKRLSESYGSADEDEGVNQASLETSSSEILQIDYSGAGYSKFYTPNSQKKESQNQMELSEYPDYFSNVLRIDDNNTEDDNSDTSNWDIYNTRSTKLAKLVESVPRQINMRSSIKNRNTLGNSIRRSLRKRTQHLRNNLCLDTEYKSNKTVRRRRKSVTYDDYKLLQKFSKLMLKPNAKSRFIIGTHQAKIERRRCGNCNAQRHSYNFTDAVCACRRNLKSTATAIMRDIQTHIRSAETAKDDVENIRDLTMYADNSDEKPDDKDLNRDISMEYDWIGLQNNDELNKGEMSPQKSKQLFDTTNAALSKSLIINFNMKRRGHKKKSNRYTIDCKFVDRMETAYRSVFHECVDFDSLLATSSLKINMDESWRSEDDSGVETIHSSWRRSVSFTEECDKDFDSALLLARKIVSEDSAKDEKCYDDEHETLKSTCYKYHDTSDVYATISKDISVNNSCSDKEDMNFMNDKMKSRITYKKKSKYVWSSVQVDRKFVKSGNNKVQDTKNNKADNTVHLMRRDPDGKTTDLEYDNDKREYVPRRITRALVKTTKENHPGKLVWGSCAGWWPALIVDAEHVGMAPCSDKLWVFWIGEKQISSLTEKTQIQPFSKNLEHRLTQPSRKNTRPQAIDATMQILRQRFNCTLTKPYYQWIQRNITEFESLDDLTFYPYPKNIQKSLDILKETNIKVTKKNLLNERRLPEATPIKKQAIEQQKNTNTSWKEIDDERLPLQDQNPGEIAWAKIAGHRWWPAMIIDYRDCNLKEPSFGCQWIMWYGDYQISEVRHLEFLKFYKGLEKMHDLIKSTVKKPYLDGVLQASKDYCARLGCSTDNWTLDNVFEYFSNKNNLHVPCKKLQVSDSNKIYDKYSDKIVKKINEFKPKPNVDAERTSDIKTSDALRRVISGECAVEKLCLKCLSFPKGRMEEHPFFIGSLCKECSDVFKPCMFVYGKDGKCFYCTICASAGTILICDEDNCPRVYCTACLKFLVCPKSYDEILLEDPWKCFLCRDESKQPENMLLRPRLDWKEKFSRMFRTVSNPASDNAVLLKCKEKRPIRVLSLFDGLSTGFLVLLNLRMVVDVYYASEIDTDVMTISSAHFGDRITQLGDVRNITKEKIQEIAPIDLLIGGSPCNDLSLVNPARLGLHDRNGTGILFFEYTRIKNLVMKANKGRHMFWLYENVASMPTEYRLEINKHFGQEPDVIDAADFSPQHRLRLYWHNLPFNPYMPLFQNQQNVQDKLTPNLNRNALCKKLRTVTTRSGSLLQPLGKAEVKPIMMKGASDNLWITELEEIFGFPRHYTDVKNLSATKRQKLLGKSWSVQTLTAILRPLCFYFKCNEDETSNISALYENVSPLYHEMKKIGPQEKITEIAQVVRAWSTVCAIELGLHQKSSLKDIIMMSYLDLYFLRTTKDERSSNFETNEIREDVVSDRISANTFDTSNQNIYNTQSTKFTKFVENVPSQTNMRDSRSNSKEKIQHLRNNRSLDQYKSNKTVRWKGKSRNSAKYDHNSLWQKFESCKMFCLKLTQNVKDRFFKGTHKTKIKQRRCKNYNVQHSYNFSNAAYACKRNLKSTAIKIISDKRAHMRSVKTAKDDVENIRDLTMYADSSDEEPDDKDLNRDISKEYDWTGLKNSTETAKDDVENIRDLTIPADSPDKKPDSKNLNRDISIEYDWIRLENNAKTAKDDVENIRDLTMYVDSSDEKPDDNDLNRNISKEYDWTGLKNSVETAKDDVENIRDLTMYVDSSDEKPDDSDLNRNISKEYDWTGLKNSVETAKDDVENIRDLTMYVDSSDEEPDDKDLNRDISKEYDWTGLKNSVETAKDDVENTRDLTMYVDSSDEEPDDKDINQDISKEYDWTGLKNSVETAKDDVENTRDLTMYVDSSDEEPDDKDINQDISKEYDWTGLKNSVETAKDDVENTRDLTMYVDSSDEEPDDKDLNQDISKEYDWTGLKNSVETVKYNVENIRDLTMYVDSSDEEPDDKDLNRDISKEYDWTGLKNSVETAKDDVENIRDLMISANIPDEKLDDKDLNRDISIGYNWIGLENNGELNNGEMSLQNKYTIDCKVDRMKATYRSVFHEVDFDPLLATSSLKINMDKSWRSENDSGVKTIHSSSRRSLSFTEECDKDFDSAPLLARKIVSDDSAKGEKCYDDEYKKTLKSTRYKYHNRSDVYATISEDTSVNNSCSDKKGMKFIKDKMKSVITYNEKSKNIWSSVQADCKFVKSGNDKVQNTKNNKADNTVHLMRKDPDNKTINLEYGSDKNEYVPRKIMKALVNITENHPGKLVWGWFGGWWPALIVDAEHVGKAPCTDKLWVFWIGEEQISLLTEKTQIQPFSKKLEYRLMRPFRINIRLHVIDATVQMFCQRFNSTPFKPYYRWIRQNITEFESLDDLTFYPYPKYIQEILDTLKKNNIKTAENNLLNPKKLPESIPINKHKDTKTNQKEIDDKYLPLQDQNPGEIIWANLGARCWPAMIIDYRDCNLKKPRFDRQWVMWYGDYKVSEVRHQTFLKFNKGIEKMHTYTKLYLDGVLQASKDYCDRLTCSTDKWTIDDIFKYFINHNNIAVPHKKLQVSDFNNIYDKYSDIIVKKINEFKKSNADVKRTKGIKTSDALRRIISGEFAVEKLCLKCLSFPNRKMEEHPFFIGSLCKKCSNVFKPCMFVYGKNGKCFYCTVCASAGTIRICDVNSCHRAYCIACLKFLICPKSYDEIILADPWKCFLCRDESEQPENMLLRPRLNWKEKFSEMTRTVSNPASNDADLLKYSNNIYDKHTDIIVEKINEFKKPNADVKQTKGIKTSDALRRVISGECAVEKLCLKCLSFPKRRMEEHPFFIGSLCKKCLDVFKPCMFVYGKNGKCFYCTICASAGTILICDEDNCPRAYCTACLKLFVCPKSYDEIILEDPWKCFLCRDESEQPENMLLRPRLNWKEKFSEMLRIVSNPASNDADLLKCKEKRLIHVLPLFDGLSTGNNIAVSYKKLQVSDSNNIYDKHTDIIVEKINEFKKLNADIKRTKHIKTSDALRRVISGECAVEKLCLKCLSFSNRKMKEHPFFIGSLCKKCSNVFKLYMFVYEKNGKYLYCTVCASAGIVRICDVNNCHRAYCTACLKLFVCPKSYDEIILEDPWKCFLCRDKSEQPKNMLLRPRLIWKKKFSEMSRTVFNRVSNDADLLKCNPIKNEYHIDVNSKLNHRPQTLIKHRIDVDVPMEKEKRPIRVLSLFDGLGTGFLVLQNLKMVVDVYYASEIDTEVMTISSAHFGDRITQLGDVRNITKEKIQEIAPIDLLIGGSPCNDLSLVNPARLGLHDCNGTGILFFEYIRIKDLVIKANKGRHMFWLYENVASMPTEYRLEMNKHFGQEPDVIDAADFSPQHRVRLYWHNLPFNPYMLVVQDQQNVQDKLTPNLNREALCKKLRTVTTKSSSLLQPLGKAEVKPIMMKGASDNLWITELEEIFGFPRHYTDVMNFSATKRQKFLGKSWSVQTVTALLRPLCFYFECNENEVSNNISTLYENISPLYHGKHF